jgi:hypothetical protein
VFENIGVFDEALRTGEDLDFWLRTREGGLNHQLLPAVTYFYRRRPVEAVGSISMHKAMIARVVKRSLERTRQLSK